jgi:hypothetical protein
VEAVLSRHAAWLHEPRSGAGSAKASSSPQKPRAVAGAGECQPVGKLVADPGVVGVEFLPPIPTQDYSTDNVDAKSEELQELFARRLEADTRASA